MLMISIVVQCNGNTFAMHRNEIAYKSIIVQFIGIALLMISIVVQCIGIALLMICIVVQCNGNTFAMLRN